MKCIRCNHDSNYPDRSGRICPNCKGTFAFEPREGDPLADMAWKNALEWVSSSGTVRFTESHLYIAIARRKTANNAGLLGVVIAAVVGTVVLPIVLGVFGAVLIAIGWVHLIGYWIWRKKNPPGLTMTRSEFDSLFSRYRLAHGSPKGLIAPGAPARPMSKELLQELAHYSFDRAVICDRKETVDVLLGNNFHFENNCAVLTASGYPEHASPIIRQMLAQNPRLDVFVLHDATRSGCLLAHNLRHDPAWFGEPPPGSPKSKGEPRSVRVYDVALRPAQASHHLDLCFVEPREIMPHPALTDDEREWLSKRTMSLDAFSPEQIIKRLFRAMQTLPELADGASDGGVILWTSDAHASDGGGDSFG